MGETDAARVDVAALLAVAGQYQEVADSIDAALRTHLLGLAFDGASAGRAYVARGDALRAGVDGIVARLREWSRAATEIAVTLRASADRYVDADARAASWLG